MAAGLPNPHRRSHPSSGFHSPRCLCLPLSLCSSPLAPEHGGTRGLGTARRGLPVRVAQPLPAHTSAAGSQTWALAAAALSRVVTARGRSGEPLPLRGGSFQKRTAIPAHLLLEPGNVRPLCHRGRHRYLTEKTLCACVHMQAAHVPFSLSQTRSSSLDTSTLWHDDLCLSSNCGDKADRERSPGTCWQGDFSAQMPAAHPAPSPERARPTRHSRHWLRSGAAVLGPREWPSVSGRAGWDSQPHHTAVQHNPQPPDSRQGSRHPVTNLSICRWCTTNPPRKRSVPLPALEPSSGY